MSRRHAAVKRQVLPDAKFGDIVFSRFINALMESGKKSVAEKIFYQSIEIVRKRVGSKDPIDLFREAINNVKPHLEVRSRRVGGATYQVPTEVREDRRLALAIRWLIQSARKRGEKTMEDKLAAEMLDAASGRGNAVKKREETHRMAEANKAFSHYRW